MDKEIINKLKSIVCEESVLDSYEDRIGYSYDATMVENLPDCIVFPRNAQEVCEIVKIASANKIPIFPRGAGSGLSGGSVPIKGGIVLVIMRMNKILEINKDDLYAVVEPGVVVADLINEVAKFGLLYPPDPSSMKVATMGGSVAENAGGLRGLKYGVTKDYVMSLDVVGSDGEIFKTGAITVKSVSGYDMTRLFVGSEGTLGIITKITVKLIPLPEFRKSMMAIFRDINMAAKTVADIIKSGVIPATLEILDKITINAVEDYKKIGLSRDAEAILLIETDGVKEAAEKEADKIINICKVNDAIDVIVAKDDVERENIWTARRSALPALGRIKPTCILEDATVPRSKIPAMIKAINEISKKYNIMIGTFGHAGDGNLHPTIITDERNKEEMQRVEKVIDEIFKSALELNGTLTGEHGIGITKMKYLKDEFGEAGVGAMKKVKQALDPYNIFNPGKLFA